MGAPPTPDGGWDSSAIYTEKTKGFVREALCRC
jgi:hypothetical protein